MKKLLKLGLALGTAIGMYGMPVSTFAETDILKEELTEHYWYDNENQKVYSFTTDGQWSAYDASTDAIKMETADQKTPSDTVLSSTAETGDYTYNEGHVTIEQEDETTINLDIIEMDDDEIEITDEAVKSAITDYQGDYVMYDEVNTENKTPSDYMVQMKEKEETNTDAGDTAGKNTMNENNGSDSSSNTDTSSEPSTASDDGTTSNETTNSSTTESTMNKVATSSLAEGSPVYISGNVYHADSSCAGSDATETTLKQAVKDGYTACEKEFSYDGYSFTTDAGEKTKNTTNNITVNVEENNVQNNTLIVNDININGNATTEESTSEEDTLTVNGKIVWKDNNNEYKVRPTKVTVILYRNGDQYKAMDITGDTSSDSWSFAFQKLAKKDENGNEYKYTIKEKALAYYRGDLDGYVLTNTYVGQAPTTSSGSKTGTQTNMVLYAGVGVAAVAAIVVLVVLNKKKQAK